MKNKRRIIIALISFIVLIVVILWIGGIIPKQIAKISSSFYLKNNFPKMQLEYVNVEWNPYFGDYIITFRDENNELHSFCIGPKYFPVSLGQGLFGFEEEYREKYSESKETESKKYIELENTPLDYNFSQMVEDKCYIVTNSNKVYHIEELDKFMENVKNKVPDEIRILQYTIEGQPILTNLEYINNKFIMKVDNRRDGYASDENRKITTEEYDEEKYELVKGNIPNVVTNLKTNYSVDLKGRGIRHTISICSYAEIKQTENEKFKIQFNANPNIQEITKILGKEETDKYDYDIYSYKGTVDILIDGEKMSLKEALIKDKITVDEILEKAQKDAREDKTIFGDVYLDGGSSFYIYNDYQILKLNMLQGIDSEVPPIKDLYIGVPSMYIGELKNHES